MASAHALVEHEVRELVRRRGIDPIVEADRTRQVVAEVIGGYLDRSVTVAMPPLGDVAVLERLVVDDVCGFGRLQPFLDDDSVEEIWINDPGRVFIARGGVSELTNVIFSVEELQDLVERMLRTSGRRIDMSTPFVDAALPDGSRLHVVIPNITRAHMAINIRKFIPSVLSLEDLVTCGALTDHAATFVEACIAAGLNVVISGGTQAGKTTMLNALCAAIPARERVVSVEEVFELRIPLPDSVAMQTRQANLEGAGEITLRRLVKEALRMRPGRLIVGEVRQEECLDLLIALNSGLPGMATLHANSAREALVKMCTLPLLAGENVSSAFIVPTVAASVDVIVHLMMDGAGRRRVTEIVAVSGRTEGDVIETADIFIRANNQLLRAGGFPPHRERFANIGIDLVALLDRRPRHSTGAATHIGAEIPA